MMQNKNRLMLYTGTALVVIGIVAACAPAATPSPTPPPTPPPTTASSEEMGSMETMKPSNGNTTPGPAITQHLEGDPVEGAKIFEDNCQKCHGEEGVGGVENPGSEEGVMPALNPVDEDMGKGNPELFALTLDLFIEHGSKPEGDNPKEVMAAWGDDNKLTPQQIADVIAYIISLNTE
jgi:mono/diheme cytochrome c family protein